MSISIDMLMYIYIYRERERYTHICLDMYIYVYKCVSASTWRSTDERSARSTDSQTHSVQYNMI